MQEIYKVLIVDDQSVSRQLFESFVEQSEKYELVKAVSSAEMVDIYLARYKVDLIIKLGIGLCKFRHSHPGLFDRILQLVVVYHH